MRGHSQALTTNRETLLASIARLLSEVDQSKQDIVVPVSTLFSMISVPLICSYFFSLSLVKSTMNEVGK